MFIIVIIYYNFKVKLVHSQNGWTRCCMLCTVARQCQSGEHFLGARHEAKHLVWIISLTPHCRLSWKSPQSAAEEMGLEKLSDFSWHLKITQCLKVFFLRLSCIDVVFCV